VEQLLFIVKKMDKQEFRVLMKHCFLAEKNTVEAKAWLDTHYADSAPVKLTVTDENIKKVEKPILNDC
jgi:hypothetical protein